MKVYLLQEPVLLIYTLFERLLDAKYFTVLTPKAKEQIRLLWNQELVAKENSKISTINSTL
jgi:hypothetical protein